MSGFNDKLLKHFLNPKNVGEIKDADGYARVENPINGYTTDIYLKIENGKITDIKFKSIGCTATIATDSAITVVANGKTLEDIICNQNPLDCIINQIHEEIGDIPDNNWHCLPTAIQALMMAIYDHYNKSQNTKRILEIQQILNEIKKYNEKKLNEL